MNPIWKIAMSENCIIAIQIIHSYLMSQDIIMERNGGLSEMAPVLTQPVNTGGVVQEFGNVLVCDENGWLQAPQTADH